MTATCLFLAGAGNGGGDTHTHAHTHTVRARVLGFISTSVTDFNQLRALGDRTPLVNGSVTLYDVRPQKLNNSADSAVTRDLSAVGFIAALTRGQLPLYFHSIPIRIHGWEQSIFFSFFSPVRHRDRRSFCASDWTANLIANL